MALDIDLTHCLSVSNNGSSLIQPPCLAQLDAYSIAGQSLVSFLTTANIHAASLFFYVDGPYGREYRGNEIDVLR